jgi:hypothetical protein
MTWEIKGMKRNWKSVKNKGLNERKDESNKEYE